MFIVYILYIYEINQQLNIQQLSTISKRRNDPRCPAKDRPSDGKIRPSEYCELSFCILIRLGGVLDLNYTYIIQQILSYKF